jgi:nucleoside-diphosphate-sugar epimerase
MNEVVETLEGIAGRTLELRKLPPAAGDVRRTSADTSRIRRELGWQPRVGLAEGLRAQWEWASARVAAR